VTQKTTDSTIITIQLGTADLNEIKRLTELAISQNTTYLSVSSDGIADLSGNALDPVPPDNAQKADAFFEDLIRPSLVEFDLDMDNGVLILTFNETVDASSLQPMGITILSDNTNTTEFAHTLTGAAYTTPEDSTVIEIWLLDSDLK